MFRCALFLLAIAVLQYTDPIAAYKNYENYRIYDVRGPTENQQRILHELSLDKSLDFLELSREVNGITRVLVPPAQVPHFEGLLRHESIPFNCLVRDASIILNKERDRQHQLLSIPLNRTTIYERFYRHAEINDYMDQLANAYPYRVFVKTVGRSFEGRWLKALIITNGDGRPNKKIIFVDATIHAREWIVPSMALHIMTELVENMNAHKHLLKDYDWIVLPVVNPDGYDYTHDIDRMWRRTRKPNAQSDCIGVDGNRNYAYGWGNSIGSSGNPCDQTYRGEHAFSEPETRVVRDLLWSYRGRLKYFLSLHSFGNYILLPWGFTSEAPETYEELLEVARTGANAIEEATGTKYKYGSTLTTIYATAGDAIDYAYGSGSAPIAMIMELPKGGKTGFDPPPEAIEAIVLETWIGIRAMASFIVAKY